MKTTVIIATIVAIAYLVGTTYFNGDSPAEADFQKFIAENRKSYFSKDEYNYRLTIFEANQKEVEVLNANPSDEAVYEINHYGDWTRAEKDQLLGYIHHEAPEGVNMLTSTNSRGSADWRGSGKMTPVKDQGSCGSCWSFSANEALESVHAIEKGELLDLSEQELVDCSGS